jgi:hypothetical protein
MATALMCRSKSSAAISFTGVSGPTLIAGEVMMSLAFMGFLLAR